MRVLSPTFNSPRNTRRWRALATSKGMRCGAMRVMSWATQDWRAAWALSESSSSTSHFTARLASTTTDPLTPTPRSRHP